MRRMNVCDSRARLQSASRGTRGTWPGATGPNCLQRRYALSYAAVYAKSACSILGSNVVSQALSFPTATNFTFKVKTEELILAFFSMKICPREKMLHVSLELKMKKGKH